MPTLATLEQQIIADYGKIKGWIATHAYLSTLIALGAGFALGKVF